MDRSNSAYSKLTAIFERTGQLHAAEQGLFWESRTMMSASAAPTRAKVMSALKAVANEQILDPKVADLLDRSEADERGVLDPWEAANLREMRRRWRHVTAVPNA